MKIVMQEEYPPFISRDMMDHNPMMQHPVRSDLRMNHPMRHPMNDWMNGNSQENVFRVPDQGRGRGPGQGRGREDMGRGYMGRGGMGRGGLERGGRGVRFVGGDWHAGRSNQDTVYVETPSAIEETGTKVNLQMDVAGFRLDQIHVKLECGGTILSVHGERTNDFGHSIKFHQRFVICEMNLDTNQLTANLSGGLLTISIPLREDESARYRIIPITASTEADAKDAASGQANDGNGVVEVETEGAVDDFMAVKAAQAKN